MHVKQKMQNLKCEPYQFLYQPAVNSSDRAANISDSFPSPQPQITLPLPTADHEQGVLRPSCEHRSLQPGSQRGRRQALRRSLSPGDGHRYAGAQQRRCNGKRDHSGGVRLRVGTPPPLLHLLLEPSRNMERGPARGTRCAHGDLCCQQQVDAEGLGAWSVGSQKGLETL